MRKTSGHQIVKNLKNRPESFKKGAQHAHETVTRKSVTLPVLKFQKKAAKNST